MATKVTPRLLVIFLNVFSEHSSRQANFASKSVLVNSVKVAVIFGWCCMHVNIWYRPLFLENLESLIKSDSRYRHHDSINCHKLFDTWRYVTCWMILSIAINSLHAILWPHKLNRFLIKSVSSVPGRLEFSESKIEMGDIDTGDGCCRRKVFVSHQVGDTNITSSL